MDARAIVSRALSCSATPELFRIRGIPVRVDWTVIVPVFVLYGDPGALLGHYALVLVHEVGHAFVRRYGGRVDGIVIHGLGGECRYHGAIGERQHVVIAWGGVLAQLVVFALALAAVLLDVLPTGGLVAWGFRDALHERNLFLVGLNLLPIPPLDGATCWKILPLFRQALRARRATRGGVGARRRDRRSRSPRRPARATAPRRRRRRRRRRPLLH